MTMTDDLRDRLTAALNAAPASFVRDDPEDAASHFEREHRRHDRHKYYGGCALCRGEAETLADAVLAELQPELDRRDELIQAARQDALRHAGHCDEYRAALARVRLLHQRCTCRRAMELATDPVVHCDCCDEDWPCSTIQILDRPELAAVLAGPTEQPKRFMAGDFLRAPKTGETPTISREFDDSIELPDLGGPAAPAGAGGTGQDGAQ